MWMVKQTTQNHPTVQSFSKENMLLDNGMYSQEGPGALSLMQSFRCSLLNKSHPLILTTLANFKRLEI